MARAPLKLDWNELMPDRNEAPPPEVELVASVDGVGGEAAPAELFMVSELSDQELNEKIQRLVTQIPRLERILPDRGKKLRSSLHQCKEELDRRDLARIKKDAGECERATQSKTTELSDPFVYHLTQKIEEKSDPAFSKELISFDRDKCKRKSENELRMNKGRQPTRLYSQTRRSSYRESPFRCASSFSNKDKQMSSNGGCRDIESSSISSFPTARNFFSHLSKRIGSENRDSMGLKSKKVPHVVLLDEEDVQAIQPIQGDAPDEWKEARIFYPSRDDPESVELCCTDIDCLAPESYLSSPIMNFYIQYLQRCPTGRPMGEYYFFNTYFYRKLEEAVSRKGDRDASFLKLRRWWKGVNIFQKAYIFIPIHRDLHWSLVIICIPAKEDESGPIILHLDSLGLHNSRLIFERVESYLKEEWNYINRNTPPNLPISERIWKNLPRRIETRKIMVPQQKNEYDCGIFVLYFMERFIEGAPERLRKKDLAMFGSKWFLPEQASGLRKRIQDLLLEEFQSARLENGRTDSPTSSCGSPENDTEQCSEP